MTPVLRRIPFDLSFCIARSNTFHTSASLASSLERISSNTSTPSFGQTLSAVLQEVGCQESSERKKGGLSSNTQPSVVENSKLRQYLDHIESTKHNLVLGDVERYKPDKKIDPRYPSYDEKYREIHRALVQSFTKPQLRKFLKLYGLPLLSTSRRKETFAEIIMENWGWEPLAKVQEERTEWKEATERSYPLSPGSAFVFMGKDGAGLLSLAKRYNVHMSFSSNPLILRVQGLRGAIKQVDSYMKYFEEDIALETTHLPLGLKISSDMSRSISRLSCAYVEARENGKLVITYRKSSPEVVKYVKHLAVQAASEYLDSRLENTIYVSERSPDDAEQMSGVGPSYSFYPFFPSQIALDKLKAGSAFRLRRVGQWLRVGARYNMDGEDVNDISLIRSCGVDVQKRLQYKISTVPLENSSRVFTASTGHILCFNTSNQATFTPPICGDVEQKSVLQWARDNSNQISFNPSIPKSLMTSWPEAERQIRRVVYKSYPENVKQVELRTTLTLEISDDPVSLGSDLRNLNPSIPLLPSIACQRSVESHLDVLLPSRTTDIRISAANVVTISPTNIPQELKSFVDVAGTVPAQALTDIPLVLTIDGSRYILCSNSKIRQSHHRMRRDKSGYDVVIETILEPEEGQHITTCKISCEDPDSGWHEFLTRCDHLTLSDSKPVSEHPLNTIQPWFQNSKFEEDTHVMDKQQVPEQSEENVGIANGKTMG